MTSCADELVPLGRSRKSSRPPADVWQVGSILLPSDLPIKNRVDMRAVAVLLVASLAAAQPPCDPGYVFFPDLAGTEDALLNVTANLSPYSGSCLRLHKRTDAFHPFPTPYKSFAVAAQDFCSYSHFGGRLLSMSSPSRSPYGMLAALAPVLANATTPLVLIGGKQNPAVKAGKAANWVWTDAATSASILNTAAGNWGVGQPEYVSVAREGGCRRGVSRVLNLLQPPLRAWRGTSWRDGVCMSACDGGLWCFFLLYRMRCNAAG